MAELSEADRRRVQKHEALKQFESKKKSYLLAFFLCLGFGYWGAHRYYLDDKRTGIAMAVIWFALLVLTLVIMGTAKVIEPLIWGYLDTYRFVEKIALMIGHEFSVFPLSEPLEDLEFPDVLRGLFGLFVVSELFQITKRTDMKNAEIKEELIGKLNE